ncbi:DUF3006 domain-containing protein [Salibacterium aidingense]|uniref:DUF3006 domain-containing protein n=1 Tax=Salibacterium aidingense TaxID=384933 RepID=UPI003BBC249A
MAMYTVDRFEGELAVLLLSGDETVQKDVPKKELPNGLEEGDVLKVEFGDNDKVITAEVNKIETELKKKNAKSLIEKLKVKNRNLFS